MKIIIDKDIVIDLSGRDVMLTDVYNGIMFRNEDGNELVVSMRDDTYEINVLPKDADECHWHRADMETGIIKPMKDEEEPS